MSRIRESALPQYNCYGTNPPSPGIFTLLITLLIHSAIGKVPVASLVAVMWNVSYHTFELSTFALIRDAFFGKEKLPTVDVPLPFPTPVVDVPHTPVQKVHRKKSSRKKTVDDGFVVDVEMHHHPERSPHPSHSKGGAFQRAGFDVGCSHGFRDFFMGVSVW